MRGSLALLVGVLLFAAAGWAVGNKSEDYCTPYAVNFGIKCMAEVDGALGSMGLPKGISLISPLMDNQNLLNTMKELLDEEDRERNLYIAFEKVSPSAACCIAACEDNAQACSCRAAVGDPPAIVQRRLYNRRSHANITVSCGMGARRVGYKLAGKQPLGLAAPAHALFPPRPDINPAAAAISTNASNGMAMLHVMLQHTMCKAARCESHCVTSCAV
ncbi:hypothetical protein HaLaN_18068, partial [Haematococcus lacustris]